jgi:hypothetical protein
MGTSDYDYGKSVASNGGISYGLNGDAYSGYIAEQQRREAQERMQAEQRRQQEQLAESLRKQNGGW